MWQTEDAYIDGKFVPVTGNEVVQIYNPSNGRLIGTTRLASRADTRQAVRAATVAQPSFGLSTKAQRIEMLQALHQAVLKHSAAICEATIEEYGGPVSRSRWVSQYSAQCFLNAARVLEEYPLQRKAGDAEIFMEPVGVSALIIPWNSTAGTLCSKLAFAIAAGCTSVIKPSEFSPLQSRVVTEALHQAGLPDGIFNILSGRGEEVGDELSVHPRVAKISFTGSTTVGKIIARAAVDSCKRLTLGMSGKSASILLDDADISVALPMALSAAFMNNGQACVAGSRLLVAESQLEMVSQQIKKWVDQLPVGDPADPRTVIGPLFSQRQYDRVQDYIRRGVQQGARLLTGGEGYPDGVDNGFFARPTVFTRVSNEMDIAREEIFGPVLSVICYRDEADAIRIANDSDYGLQAYIFSQDPQRAFRVSRQLEAGSVLINRIVPELMAPFGGVKQSGIGRELGISGLESFLEPKSVVIG